MDCDTHRIWQNFLFGGWNQAAGFSGLSCSFWNFVFDDRERFQAFCGRLQPVSCTGFESGFKPGFKPSFKPVSSLFQAVSRAWNLGGRFQPLNFFPPYAYTCHRMIGLCSLLCNANAFRASAEFPPRYKVHATTAWHCTCCPSQHAHRSAPCSSIPTPASPAQQSNQICFRKHYENIHVGHYPEFCKTFFFDCSNILPGFMKHCFFYLPSTNNGVLWCSVHVII